MAGPPGCSSSIARLSAALAKAQGQIEGASKDRTADVVAKSGAKFKYDYATLAAIWDACRKPLSDHGLAVLQLTSADGSSVGVTTLLAHSSGEWVRSELHMEAETKSPQAIGSCITYARKYALAAIVGVAPDDDDGTEASRQQSGPSEARDLGPRYEPPLDRPPHFFDENWHSLEVAAADGKDEYQRVWGGMKGDFKTYARQHRKDKLAALEVRAAEVSAQAKGKP